MGPYAKFWGKQSVLWAMWKWQISSKCRHQTSPSLPPPPSPGLGVRAGVILGGFSGERMQE